MKITVLLLSVRYYTSAFYTYRVFGHEFTTKQVQTQVTFMDDSWHTLRLIRAVRIMFE